MSEPAAFIPMEAASSKIPPVPQKGSNRVSPFFIPVRLMSALAYLGWREIGEKKGLFATLLSSKTALSISRSEI